MTEVPRRVLVVDDDVEMAELIAERLRQADFEVLGAQTSATTVFEQAVVLARGAPLLIVFDVDWHGLPSYGVHTAKLLKGLNDVWVILCSDLTDEQLEAHTRSARADGYIRKDDVLEIGPLVEDILGGRGAHEEGRK